MWAAFRPNPLPLAVGTRAEQHVLEAHKRNHQKKRLCMDCATRTPVVSENKGFPRNPSLAPLPLLITVCSVQGRALPPVRWMFDFYCAVSGGQRNLGNQPNKGWDNRLRST